MADIRNLRDERIQKLVAQVISDQLTLADILENQRNRTGAPDAIDELATEWMPDGKNFCESERAQSAAVADFKATLTPEQLDHYAAIEDAETENGGAFHYALFELGKRCGLAVPGSTSAKRPALERFIDAVQSAVLLKAGAAGAVTEDGTQDAIQTLKEATPVARAIALLDNPLDSTAEPLNALIRAKHRAIEQQPEDATDPNHECAKDAATEAAVYFVALAIGLLLADQV